MYVNMDIYMDICSCNAAAAAKGKGVTILYRNRI